MAFRPIDEIPKPPAELAKTIRQRIRDDIKDAETLGVYKFEFTGDYNFKTLASTAHEEADRLNKQAVNEYREQKEAEDKANGDVYYSEYDKSLPKKYNISSIRTDKVGVRRVFCEIIPENVEKSWQIAYERHMKNKQAQAEMDAEKAKRPKLKMDDWYGEIGMSR